MVVEYSKSADPLLGKVIKDYLFVQAIGLFWFPLTGIASFWSQFQLGLAAGERVFALIETACGIANAHEVARAVVRDRDAELVHRYVTV